MFRLLGKQRHTLGLEGSKLYDQQSFYAAFASDLARCKDEAIIECPFITTRRTTALIPSVRSALARGVRVVVNTKSPSEYGDILWAEEAQSAIVSLQEVGTTVLFTGGHHRKLAIFDRSILYEGSLNILSQNDSSEIMRRIHSPNLAMQMIRFIKLDAFLR